jgi:signal transduction histidine kinase/CheY-like chemotaxis protein
MIDPTDPVQEQLAKQAKIIDALVRRANRQNDVGLSAYGAFQSAVALQAQVWAKTRDLERTASELESVRYERERTRSNLTHALAAMEGGFAVFADGQLQICNDLFRKLMPDISDRIVPGLVLEDYFDAMSQSRHVLSTDGKIHSSVAQMNHSEGGAGVVSVVIELDGDRWYQLSLQRTSPGNVVVLLTDITSIVRENRIEKEHLIDRQADYLQAVFEDMTSGVCTFSPDEKVMMHNGQFRLLLGLPYTMLQKGTDLSGLLEFIVSNQLVRDPDAVNIDFWRSRLRAHGRLRSRLRHATDRVLDLQAHRLPDGGFLVELKDVTLETRATETLENRVLERTAELTRANERLTEEYDKKARVEEQLRLAKEQAEAAVSSKTRFLAAASHDLLQPVNAAKLLIATLKEQTRQTRHAAVVERLFGSFASIEQLLHSLLDISRLDSADASAVNPTDVCLGLLMQGVYEDQRTVAAQKGVRLDVVPANLFVRSDSMYLLRSIQNLVVNAIQYTDPGGRVLVGCRRRGDKVVLQVWDTGIGINARDQHRIFEEFTRAENVPLGSGVGLGLSVVERTCRHLDHKLWVRSKPGVGSLFCIEMDVIEGRAEQTEQAPMQVGADTMALDHIVLVVENDEDVLFATTQKLEQWGASVFAARSTEEAEQFVRDIDMPPDIILADYQLDNGDTGIRAIQSIREMTGVKVPAIMITADRSDKLIRTGAKVGFTVLTKPVQLSRLRPLIDWKIRWQSPEIPSDRLPTKVGNDSAA